MAFSFFLNFEKVAIRIIESEIAQMTNNNTHQADEYGLVELNEDVFINNLTHGSVVTAFIANLYEASLNTIITRRLTCHDKKLLRWSSSEKITHICKLYGIDQNKVKSHYSFATVKEVVGLRNDILHYKTNEIGVGSFVPGDIVFNMGKTQKSLAGLFTQKNMERYYNGVIEFLEMLCSACNLRVNKSCQIIDCDGRDDLCEFIISPPVT